ncbi:MAG: vWA domain-containing protein [Roseibacillus sp.]
MKLTTIKWAVLCGTAAMIGATSTLADLPGKKIEKAESKAVEAKPADVSKPGKGQSKVQLAILLDTSGSMSGLIEQTKTQLWSIVNTFIDAEQNGKVPFVEVALYEYGNDGLNAENHWIRQIQPLTRDLDKISEDLFALRTNGGSEYCGAVIERAIGDLKWDTSTDVYKAIFVAGNEPFTQGPIDPTNACKAAIAKGVIVNTIHCGNERVGINTGWKSGAMLADGKFLIIDHNKAVVHIDAPQDVEILEWNKKLNGTYVPMGKIGIARLATQSVQDALAEKSKGNAIQQRAATKASANYWNGNWDWVDACAVKEFKWEDMKVEDLPEEMKKMTVDERKAFIAKKKTERIACQTKIQELTKERASFVEARLKELGEDGDTLDKVVVQTVREQAEAKGYKFAKK